MGKKIAIGYHYETQLAGYTAEPVYGTVSKSTNSSASKTEICSQSASGQVTMMRSVTDDGVGGFYDNLGLVDYASKSIIIKVAGDYSTASFNSVYEDHSSWSEQNSGGTLVGGLAPSSGGGGSASFRGGESGSVSSSEVVGASILCRYKIGPSSPQTFHDTFTPPAYQIDLLPNTAEAIVPGSLQFVWMGVTYQDYEGYIYRGRTSTNPGIVSGVVDYESGILLMNDYVVGSNPYTVTIQSLYTNQPPRTVAQVVFNTIQAPVKPTGLVVSLIDLAGNQIVVTADLDGKLIGPHTNGVVDYESGSVEIQFGDLVLDTSLTAEQKAEWWYNAADIDADGKIWKPWPVYPQSLRYDVVSYTYLPLDAALLGLDPVRLPADGRVPIFKKAGVVVVHHSDQYTLPQPATPSTTYDMGVTDVAEAWLVDSKGAKVPTNQYGVDLETGMVTLLSNFTLGALQEPLLAKYRLEDMSLLTDVQINGALTLANPLTRDYPLNSFVSSAILFGDLNARCTNVFDLQAFAGWSDIAGAGANAQYNNIDYPILVVNEGAVTERWRIHFTGTTTFQVIGENLGVIEVTAGNYVGNTSTNVTPVNKLTGKPYFQLSAAGWGAGWAAGNQLRFNTVSAAAPIWIARTILPGATLEGDSFSMQLRGDVDVTI